MPCICSVELSGRDNLRVKCITWPGGSISFRADDVSSRAHFWYVIVRRLQDLHRSHIVLGRKGLPLPLLAWMHLLLQISIHLGLQIRSFNG